MNIYDTVDIYTRYSSISNKRGANALDVIDDVTKSGKKALIDKMIEKGMTKEEIMALRDEAPKKGRKPKVIMNPHFKMFITAIDAYSNDDTQDDVVLNSAKVAIDDLTSGVCRNTLESCESEKMNLSPSKMKKLMSNEELTIALAERVLIVSNRQARRYIKASEHFIKILDIQVGRI